MAATMAPKTPTMSAATVSSGSAMASAAILGSTRTSIGEAPTARSESISPVIFIAPICAAYADRERPHCSDGGLSDEADEVIELVRSSPRLAPESLDDAHMVTRWRRRAHDA